MNDEVSYMNDAFNLTPDEMDNVILNEVIAMLNSDAPMNKANRTKIAYALVLVVNKDYYHMVDTL